MPLKFREIDDLPVNGFAVFTLVLTSKSGESNFFTFYSTNLRRYMQNVRDKKTSVRQLNSAMIVRLGSIVFADKAFKLEKVPEMKELSLKNAKMGISPYFDGPLLVRGINHSGE